MAKKIVRAFAPANVSCIFSTYYGNTALETGSHGVGFTLNQGVRVEVTEGDSNIFVDSELSDFPTVAEVVSKLAKRSVSVSIRSDLPFGSGFGLSGASALATALAINQYFSLSQTTEDLALIAHVAEVNNGTGLGDVAGQLHGGIMIRVDQGEPLSVYNLDISEQEIFYQVFGPIETKSVISSEEKRVFINSAGNAALSIIKNTKDLDFEKLVEISKVFSLESGLLKSEKVVSLISEIESSGGKASMIMLGEAVYSNIPFEGCKKAMISKEGARLL